MKTIILKFGGSSVADNDRLKIVADKIIKFYNKGNNIVVVVSAQGKTTNELEKQIKELVEMPVKREMDVLLSTGEQITIAKLAILLNSLGYEAISFTGWQAGIHTSCDYQNAKIEDINTEKIMKELSKRKIVIIAGFQGIDKNNNITTLGRGGSDTTAVALAAKLKADKCYIYSDVDGIYSADPNTISNAKKIPNISYEEMYNLSDEGAKVLHNRCVEIGEKYKVPIIAESTFNNNSGTIINDKLEGTGVKSIVKKDISKISVIGYGISNEDKVLEKIINISKQYDVGIYNIDINNMKILITFKDKVNDSFLKELHDELIINV